MTIQQALYIKWLRYRHDATWRYIAAMYYNRYIDKKPYHDNIVYGRNQREGMNLWDQVMKVLNKTIKTNPNWN